MFELLLDNKNGYVWDMSELVHSISWKTSRIGRASSLEFSFIKGALYQNTAFAYNNGDIIRFRMDDRNVFYGYAFSIEDGRDESVKITAYDQLRYLMSNDTYVFSNTTATKVIQQIAKDYELKTGALADTGYTIPSMVEDSKKVFDTVCKALDLTLIATKRNYVLYDDFGVLTLRNINDMRVDIAIGDDSLMYDYEHKRTIDQETANQVKLVQDNKKTKKRDVYIARDSANIKRWGKLQHYDKVDEKMNSAQINEVLNNLLANMNREQQTLKVTALGDLRIRAGCFVPIVIGEQKISQYFLVDECTHNFDGSDHTMTIELKVI
ncbi:XkdQ/YqbQ family protein [Paenibacillus chitinolyticus]